MAIDDVTPIRPADESAGNAFDDWTLFDGDVGHGRRRRRIRWAECGNVYFVDWRPGYRRRQS
jgi:hypothetical protein